MDKDVMLALSPMTNLDLAQNRASAAGFNNARLRQAEVGHYTGVS
jgi:hypothetical protein